MLTGCRLQAMLLRRCADVAAGLTYLHSRNVCHGDLKCENVLLRTGGPVHLVDHPSVYEASQLVVNMISRL